LQPQTIKYGNIRSAKQSLSSDFSDVSPNSPEFGFGRVSMPCNRHFQIWRRHERSWLDAVVACADLISGKDISSQDFTGLNISDVARVNHAMLTLPIKSKIISGISPKKMSEP